MTETSFGKPRVRGLGRSHNAAAAGRTYDLKAYADDLASRHANDQAYIGKSLYAVRVGNYVLGIAGESNVLMDPFFDNRAFTFETRRIPTLEDTDAALLSTGHLAAPDGIVEA